MNYYNEHDPKIAAWLRGLISAGLIPDGHVDTRSIVEVMPGDLEGFTQCHFFAGIGGWSLALRLAGWPTDRPVWTGSCPCQPFSQAGKRKGTDDKRHLWPEFARLIRECRPATVFGEQVAGGDGRKWLSGVFADLEGMGYAAAGADLCAAGVGSPHIRQRLFWVGHSDNPGSQGRRVGPDGQPVSVGREDAERFAGLSGVSGGVADSAMHAGPEHEHEPREGSRRATGPCDSAERGGDNGWSRFRVIPCGDGKARRIEPGTFPLADAGRYVVPSMARRRSVRPALLHGAGNAIVAEVAATFIKAFLTI